MSRKAFLAVCLLLGTVLAVAGAGCGPRAGPDRPPAAQGPPRQPLPEKTAEVAGVKVTVGGGVREGVYHLATFDAGGTFDYAAPDVLFSPDGRTVAEFPLTVGIVGAVFAPVLAAIGAIAALAADYTLVVEREGK